MICVLVYFKVPIIGVLMAAGGVITWAVVPAYQVVKYLALDPELHRKRKRAISFSVAMAAVAALLIFQIRFPVHIEFTGIVQPDDPVNAAGVAQSGDLKSAGKGWVVKVLARDGDIVKAGQPILQLDDAEVRQDLAYYKSKVQETDDMIRQARVKDQSELIEDTAELQVYQDQLKDAQRRESEMTIRAPFQGWLVAPNLHELASGYIAPGQEIGRVEVLDKLVVRGDIDQTDYQLIQNLQGVKVEIRLAGLLGKSIPGGAVTLPVATVDELADPSLGSRGGGEQQVDPRDPNGLRAQQGAFEARVKLDNQGRVYYPGQRAYVRLTLDARTLAWQWTNRFFQLIQAKSKAAQRGL